MGNKAIKDLMVPGAKMLSRPRKSGPKKEKTSKSTDQELRQFIEDVKGIMSISAKVSRINTLSAWTVRK